LKKRTLRYIRPKLPQLETALDPSESLALTTRSDL
jgi:hypothetical protein